MGMNEMYIKKTEDNTRKFDEGLKELTKQKDLKGLKNNELIFVSKKYDDNMILPEYMVTSVEVHPGVFLLYHTAREDINLNDSILKIFGVFNGNTELLYISDEYHNSYIDVEKSKYYSKYSIKKLEEDLRNVLQLSVVVYINNHKDELYKIGEDLLEELDEVEECPNIEKLTYSNLNNLTWYIQREFIKFIDEKEEDNELSDILLSYIIDKESDSVKEKTVPNLLSKFLEEVRGDGLSHKEVIAYNLLQFQKDKK